MALQMSRGAVYLDRAGRRWRCLGIQMTATPPLLFLAMVSCLDPDPSWPPAASLQWVTFDGRWTAAPSIECSIDLVREAPSDDAQPTVSV